MESKRALEWISETGGKISAKDESRRISGLLVLTELARSAPAMFYSHVIAFLDSIWGPLRDPSIVVRVAAVYALQAALALISERPQGRVEALHFLFEEVLVVRLPTPPLHLHA